MSCRAPGSIRSPNTHWYRHQQTIGLKGAIRFCINNCLLLKYHSLIILLAEKMPHSLYFRWLFMAVFDTSMFLIKRIVFALK